MLVAVPSGTGLVPVVPVKYVPAGGAWGDDWGMAVAVDGEWAVVGAPDAGTFTSYSHGDAAVLRKVGPAWFEFSRLTTAATHFGSRFGAAVAISGDAIVVGAPYQAAAYVFRWTGTAWTEEATLTAPAVGRTLFGGAVAIDGDLVAVGDYLSGPSGTNPGAVHVFRHGAGGWTHEARLEGDAGSGGLGWSVAVDAGRVLAGAPWADGAMTGTGAASLFAQVAGNWTRTARLTASDGVRNDQYGRSVGLDGPLAAVGSYWDRTTADMAGSAYVYALAGGVWAEASHLVPPDPAYMQGFGWSLAFQGGRLAVGAMHDGTLAANSGAVYLYPLAAVGLPAGLPVPAVKLKAPDAEAGAQYGVAVALDGDTLLVGAPTDDWRVGPGSTYTYAWPDLVGTVTRAAGL